MSELNLLRNLYKKAKRLRSTAPVDDDFPEMMHDFDCALYKASKEVNTTPKIVCLCGSTRFKPVFEQVTFEETMKGNIVLSVGCFAHYDEIMLTTEQKEFLDELHSRKIELANEIIILNVDGYIGDSTKAEVKYAQVRKKEIRWLEPNKITS